MVRLRNRSPDLIAGQVTAGRRAQSHATWWLYIVRTHAGALYTGIALDVAARFAAHRSGRGAKALRGRGPLAIVLRTKVGPRGLALRVEHRVKQLRKVQKERLVTVPLALRRLIAAVRDQCYSRSMPLAIHAELTGVRSGDLCRQRPAIAWT